MSFELVDFNDCEIINTNINNNQIYGIVTIVNSHIIKPFNDFNNEPFEHCNHQTLVYYYSNQPYYTNIIPNEYSFSLYPSEHQPSCTIN